MAKQQNKPATPPKVPKAPVVPVAPEAPKVNTDQSKLNKEILRDYAKQKLAQTDLNDIAKDLSNTWKDLSNAISLVSKNQDVLGDKSQEYSDLIKDIYSNIEDIGTENFKQINVQDQLNKLQQEQKDLVNDITKESNLIRDNNNKINELVAKKNKLQEIANKAEASGNDLTAAKALYMQDVVDKEIELAKEITAEAKLSHQIKSESLDTANNQLQAAIDLLTPLAAANEMMKIADETAQEFGISIEEISGELMAPFENAMGFLKNVPGGGIMGKFFGVDKKLAVVQKAITDSFISGLATTGSVGSASFMALKAGAQAFMTSLGPILIPLLAIAATAALIKSALDQDQEVTDMAKNLGMSKDEARGIHEELLGIAADTKVIGANSKALHEAFADLTAITGQNTVANKEMLETQVLLTKQYGMTGKEAAAFQQSSIGQGKTAEQVLGTVKNMTESYNKMTGDSLNFKEITKDVAKATKSQLASYKGNTAELTKAVIQAKKLGVTLETASSISANLLDFESSIEAEMAANVLTGKSMNMNAARQLALQGDIVGAAAAALEQAGSYDEFLHMEMYQKEAIAKAAGMTVDQMMEAGELQKMSVALGGKQIKNMSELTEADRQALVAAGAISETKAKELALEEQKVSLNDKLSAMGDKLMALFAKLAEPVMAILDPIINLIDFLMPVLTASFNLIMQPIKAVFDIFGGINKMIHGDFMGGLHDIGAAILSFFIKPFQFVYDLIVGFFPSIGKMIDDAFSFIKDAVKDLLPEWAISLIFGTDDKTKKAEAETETAAASTGPVDTNMVQTPNDAVIDPAGGLVVQGKKGTYQLDKKDSIVAGTDLQPKSSDTTSDTQSPESEGTGILGNLASTLMSPLGAIIDAVSGKPSEPASSSNSEVVALLKELIKKIDQPVQFNISGKVIDEIDKVISVNRSYSRKDNSYSN